MAYVYPKLPAVKTSSFFRIGGYGLANCLYVYARAIAIANKYNLPIIKPTWFNLSLGPYLRREKDKRHYLGLIDSHNEISGIKKFYLLNTLKHVSEYDDFEPNDNIIIEVSQLGEYFAPIIPCHDIVSKYLYDHIEKKNLLLVEDFNFTNCIAAHVRLGDYVPDRRVPLSWYKEKILSYLENTPNTTVLLFSDGRDEELKELLEISSVRRVFFGNSIADIVAISKCKFLIGSDSTFSAWGAYLGQVPSVFLRLKCKPVLIKREEETVELV